MHLELGDVDVILGRALGIFAFVGIFVFGGCEEDGAAKSKA